jgi:nucleoside-specific outer membrane channel protein Tsx
LQAEDEAKNQSDKAFKQLYGYGDYPLYGGYESYESDEDNELFTYIDPPLFDKFKGKVRESGILNIKTLKF